VQNALQIFRKLGDKYFEVLAAKVIATSYRYAGRLADAEHELNRALALSRERDLRDWIPGVTIDIARVRIESGDYDSARKLLQEALSAGAGRDAAIGLVTLGRVQTRMGDFSSAQESLETAARDVKSTGMSWLLPSIYLAMGDLAEQSTRMVDAKSLFQQASNLWVDGLPDAASVEARARVALLNAQTGHATGTSQVIASTLKQARAMGAHWLEARCLLFSARLAELERRHEDAVSFLGQIKDDGEVAIGPELQAEVHYWRGRSRVALGQNADGETAAARKLIEGMAATLSESGRSKFLSRPEIASIVG
jgi:FimV-like protein